MNGKQTTPSVADIARLERLLDNEISRTTVVKLDKQTTTKINVLDQSGANLSGADISGAYTVD